MAKNKDGLEAGAPVDFETMTRINRNRSVEKKVIADAEEPKPRARRTKSTSESK